MNFAISPHKAFREWYNDFLTLEGFASYHGIEIEEARALIEEGRRIEHETKQIAIDAANAFFASVMDAIDPNHKVDLWDEASRFFDGSDEIGKLHEIAEKVAMVLKRSMEREVA
jgi:hypothetical protein